MLAGARCCFLIVLAVIAIAFVPVQAQVIGVSPPLPSFGVGARGNPAPGVPVLVPPLGLNAYANSQAMFGGCCSSFFLPTNPNTQLPTHGHHHRGGDKNKDQANFGVGVIEPIYVPYAAPYAADDDAEGGSSDQASYPYASGAQNADVMQRPPHRDMTARAATDGEPVAGDPTPAAEPPVPVAAQPPTILVFKDGHRSEVLNYAVVGDTLFDFGADRTHKILLADLDLAATRKVNDDRGVDFQIPAGAARQ